MSLYIFKATIETSLNYNDLAIDSILDQDEKSADADVALILDVDDKIVRVRKHTQQFQCYAQRIEAV